MRFPVHRGLGIAPNIEPPVVKAVFHPTFHPQAYACFERTDRTLQAGLLGSDSGASGLTVWWHLHPLNQAVERPNNAAGNNWTNRILAKFCAIVMATDVDVPCLPRRASRSACSPCAADPVRSIRSHARRPTPDNPFPSY